MEKEAPVSDGTAYVAASAFSLEALADIFTRSFEAYFYPGVTTAEALARRVREEQIDLAHSPVLLLDGEPAGMALLAVREERAWCGGFGIMLPHRGRGMAKPLASELIARARASAALRLELEVLTRNERAVRTYAGCGFRTRRDLQIFEWCAPGDGEGVALGDEGVRWSERGGPRAGTLLTRFGDLHHAHAAWQRDLPALLVKQGLQHVSVERGGALVGYALFVGRERGVRIEDLGAATVEDAAALLRALQGVYGRIISVNEPSDSPITAAYPAVGFVEVDRQHEMVLEL